MIPKNLWNYLVAAAVILAAAAGLKYAAVQGLLGAGGADRAAQVMIGLGLALYANLIPKRLGALRGPIAERRALLGRRLAGWTFTLSGLAYAGLWRLAPAETAFALGIAAVASAVVLTLGYTIWACGGGSADAQRPTA
jgi:hypothetical protein